MENLARLVIAALLLCAPGLAAAQQPFPAIVVNAVELSGDGAVAGNNFNNGVLLAFKEINAAGGILGQRIEVISLDTQTKPEIAKAALQKAAQMDAYAVMGPVFSDLVLANMEEIQRAEIPTFIGAEAASLTMRGNPYLFRTSHSQATSMPRLARYMKDTLRAQTVAMIWVQNEFGKSGRDAMGQALQAEGIQVVADLPTTPEQKDFAAVVEGARASRADAVFVYLNEDESADCLRVLHDQGFGGWIVGESTLIGQSVLERAREAANGIRGHVGLTPDALVPSIRNFDNRFRQEYNYKSDHNGMKGYIAAYVIKAATEKVGKFDRQALAKAMKDLTLSAAEHSGILLDVKYDDKGDLDRVSFIVQVSNRQHQFIAMLPTLAGDF